MYALRARKTNAFPVAKHLEREKQTVDVKLFSIVRQKCTIPHLLDLILIKFKMKEMLIKKKCNNCIPLYFIIMLNLFLLTASELQKYKNAKSVINGS